MRYVEISSGLRMPLSEEEEAIYDRDQIDPSELDEREAEVARVMVRKGSLISDGEYLYANKWMD